MFTVLATSTVSAVFAAFARRVGCVSDFVQVGRFCVTVLAVRRRVYPGEILLCDYRVHHDI
eukprot:4273438-Lingulodinium_polyedra.AAC.1